MCVLDCQRLIFPNFAFLSYTKPYFSRLNTAKMKTSGSPGNSGQTACLLCNHRRRKGFSEDWRKVTRD